MEIIEEDEYEKNKEIKAMQIEETGPVVELSINSVGLSNPGTMKVKGRIKEEVIVLIDCGATHNFISEKLVSMLQLPIKDTSHL